VPNPILRPFSNILTAKNCADSFCHPLSILFNRSISEKYVPLIWRCANITLIFKKGSRVEASNYRPVSLTSTVSKVLEGCVKDALMHHLNSNRLLSENQHGFVPNKSCTTNLLESFDYITVNIEMKNGVYIVYLDFSKAFDKVCHRLLLLKLRSYGVHLMEYTIRSTLSARLGILRRLIWPAAIGRSRWIVMIERRRPLLTIDVCSSSPSCHLVYATRPRLSSDTWT
jgi:hypothetical protein